MSVALSLPLNHNFLAAPRNTGSSTYATQLNDLYESAISHLREPVSSKKMDAAYQELLEVVRECTVENWDGYNAKSVNRSAIAEAFNFLGLLPSDAPVPEVMAEPNGDVGFEWEFGPNKVFAVSVTGNYSLAYAGLLGAGSRIKGIEAYSEEIPSVVLEGIKRIAK